MMPRAVACISARNIKPSIMTAMRGPVPHTASYVEQPARNVGPTSLAKVSCRPQASPSRVWPQVRPQGGQVVVSTPDELDLLLSGNPRDDWSAERSVS